MEQRTDYDPGQGERPLWTSVDSGPGQVAFYVSIGVGMNLAKLNVIWN
jgi:hypothetical protein